MVSTWSLIVWNHCAMVLFCNGFSKKNHRITYFIWCSACSFKVGQGATWCPSRHWRDRSEWGKNHSRFHHLGVVTDVAFQNSIPSLCRVVKIFPIMFVVTYYIYWVCKPDSSCGHGVQCILMGFTLGKINGYYLLFGFVSNPKAWYKL